MTAFASPDFSCTSHGRDLRSHGLRLFGLLVVALLTLTLAGCSSGHTDPHWQLNASVRGHLPDLDFHLLDDHGKAVTGADYRGKVAILYFGYTHCPDVCPLTLTHLHMVMQKLGPLADRVRILFVSVDPARDTPAILHAYVTAFDQHAVGLTGSESQIKHVAKRFRVAYSRGADNAHGGYEVNHSSALYIFDGKGHIRLLATPADTPSAIAHDVHQLLTLAPAS